MRVTVPDWFAGHSAGGRLPAHKAYKYVVVKAHESITVSSTVLGGLVLTAGQEIEIPVDRGDKVYVSGACSWLIV